MLYRGMDRAALDAAHDNAAAVVGQARRDGSVADWTTRSDALRAARPGRLDLRYGHGGRQRLDVLACGAPGAPTLAYIHGGYWQTMGRGAIARTLARDGADVVFGLPGVRLYGVPAGLQPEGVTTWPMAMPGPVQASARRRSFPGPGSSMPGRPHNRVLGVLVGWVDTPLRRVADGIIQMSGVPRWNAPHE